MGVKYKPRRGVPIGRGGWMGGWVGGWVGGGANTVRATEYRQ